MLKLLPSSLKRQRQELSLQLVLASLYRVTRGWGVPELQQVLERALTLCDLVGNDAQRVQVLYGLQSLYVVRGTLEKVQFLYVAQPRAWQSHALWCLGYPQQALECVLGAVKLAQNLQQPFNQPQVSAYLALLQQMRADEATARRYAEEALALTTR